MGICNYNSVLLKPARSAATLAAIGANATIAIYTGSVPVDPSSAPTGTLLSTLACSPVFGVVTPGVAGGVSAKLTANPITQGTGLANGVPGYARIQTAAGVGVVDLDCGASGSGASVIVTPDQVLATAWVQIPSLVISEG